MIAGRVVIVTGAGRGLGRAFARGLSLAGARVVVNDIGRSESGSFIAEEVASEIREEGGEALASTDSVTSEQGVASLVADSLEAFGEIYGLVNNAGIVNSGPFREQTVDQFRSMLDVHVVGTFLMAREVWPHLSQASGSVVNIASNVGYFGLEGMASYAAAKGGVSGLTRVLALEGAGEVRVNGLTPMADTNPGRTAAAKQMFEGMAGREDSEWVVPLLLQLLDPECPSHGEVYSAVGGRYARIDSVVGSGWVAPDQVPPSAAELRENWDRISDLTPHHELHSMKDEVGLVKALLGVSDRSV